MLPTILRTIQSLRSSWCPRGSRLMPTMSVPSFFLAVYLELGMGTSLAMWMGKQDEIELALTLDLDDENDRPLFRMFLTLFFLLAWPLVVWDAFSRDR
jgi:hypothetical protein